ncbi:PfkB family carbohydrate kinase [Microbacterium elymi]|uniref:PfkB family carbohydrate kinase n=1 Tax=Microbacterium elymi TaxID=2909587 RepID=A0ABY5NI11_9MICO|nr:PfkB family carbohydrate kinase [Microbacterium elymi]UUT34834.1 PfkB family carbohydrate kinase [Microbacterium elymi]
MLRDRAEFVRGFESLAGRSRLVKVGEEDASLLYASELDILRTQLSEDGAEVVLATAGAAGAVLQTGGTVVNAPIAAAPGGVVDTMGAGDAVFASVVASMVRDAPADAPTWEEALEQAMAIAAATVRFHGALRACPARPRPRR